MSYKLDEYWWYEKTEGNKIRLCLGVPKIVVEISKKDLEHMLKMLQEE